MKSLRIRARRHAARHGKGIAAAQIEFGSLDAIVS
jgi:hypothetical protein